MNYNEFQAVFFAFAILILGLVADSLAFETPYQTLKNNENTALFCHMKDGYREIEKDKINGFFKGEWEFTNGKAKNCEVKKK